MSGSWPRLCRSPEAEDGPSLLALAAPLAAILVVVVFLWRAITSASATLSTSTSVEQLVRNEGRHAQEGTQGAAYQGLPAASRLQRSLTFKIVHELGKHPDIESFMASEAATKWDGNLFISLRFKGQGAYPGLDTRGDHPKD